MKNTILGLMVVAVLIAVPMASHAETIDVQSQINSLLSQIKVLQQQLAELIKKQATSISIPTITTTSSVLPNKDRICSAIKRNLWIGVQGEDVSALQDFLSGQGFFSGGVTGYFGSVTSQALARWQSTEGLESVGNLGPLSRDRILKWCGTGGNEEWKLRASPHKGAAPLAVTFGANVTLANGNMVADAGDYKILFGDGAEHVFTCSDSTGMCKGPHTVQHTYATAGSYKAELIHYGYYGAPNPDGSISSYRSVGTIVIDATGPVACTMEYNPVCGSKQVVCIASPCNPVQQTYSNKCAMNADGATYLYGGECKVTPEPARFEASPSEGVAPLSVTFSTWLSGFRVPSVSFKIDFGDGSSETATSCLAPADACVSPGLNNHTYQRAGTYTATLNKITDPCSGQVACRAAIHSEVMAKVQVKVKGTSACTKEYRPVCGEIQIQCITTPCNPVRETYSNLCMMQQSGATYVSDGECRNNYPNPADDPKCKSWYDGCNSCSRESASSPAMCTLRACMQDSMTKPYCTAYFDSSSTNKPPVISGISGPTTLAVGAMGTWVVKAGDPENGTLAYSVDWGEAMDLVWPANRVMAGYLVEAQTSTFTHAYSYAGTYVVKVSVKDSGGISAYTSITVKVGSDGTVACTEEYAPVCGRPSGCVNTCPAGMYCALMCQMPEPVTYSNKCKMSSAGAEFLHFGQCSSTSGSAY